jgi:hypothetical protein
MKLNIEFKYYLLILIIFVMFIFYYFDESILLKPFYEYKGLFNGKIELNKKFLDHKKCNEICNKIRNNVHVEENPLNELFEKSRGMIFEFDTKSAYSELSSKNCEFLYGIFEEIKKPYANNFIMNTLILDTENMNNETENVSNDMAVDYHYDTTISKTPKSIIWGIERCYLPECVSVIYVDLPESFEGGELDICSYFYNLDLATIRPELGTLLEFDGKYLHGVNVIKNTYPRKSSRISIVLEQYCI